MLTSLKRGRILIDMVLQGSRLAIAALVGLLLGVVASAQQVCQVAHLKHIEGIDQFMPASLH